MARDVEPKHCDACDEITPHARRVAGLVHLLRTRSLTRVSCERCRWRGVMVRRRERRRLSPFGRGAVWDVL